MSHDFICHPPALLSYPLLDHPSLQPWFSRPQPDSTCPLPAPLLLRSCSAPAPSCSPPAPLLPPIPLLHPSSPSGLTTHLPLLTLVHWRRAQHHSSPQWCVGLLYCPSVATSRRLLLMNSAHSVARVLLVFASCCMCSDTVYFFLRVFRYCLFSVSCVLLVFTTCCMYAITVNFQLHVFDYC